MDNLKELAQQNGNQAAAVLVPYHESESGGSNLAIARLNGHRDGDSYIADYSENVLSTNLEKYDDGCGTVTYTLVVEVPTNVYLLIFPSSQVRYLVPQSSDATSIVVRVSVS